MTLRQKTIFDQFSNIGEGGIMGGDMGYSDPYKSPALSAYDPPDPMRNMDPANDPNNEFSKYVNNDISGISDVSGVSNIRPSAVPFDRVGEQKKYTTMMNELYTPATRSDDRLNKLLDETPDINNYNPSFARKLVAGLQSIKDPTLGQKTLNQPYLQDMGQWKEKTGPFQAAATGENQRNIQERTLAGNIVNNMTVAEKNYQLAQQSEERNRITEENNKMRDEVARTRNNIERFKAAKLQVEVRGSRVIGYKADGSSVDLGSSRGMDEIDKITMQGENQIRAAAATGTGVFQDPKSGERFRIDPKDPTKLVPMQGGPTSPLDRIGTGSNTTKPNALEADRERQAKLRDLYERNVEGVNKTIVTKGSDGRFVLNPKPQVGSGKFMGYFGDGVTRDQVALWDMVKAEIDGTVPPAAPGTIDTPGGVPEGQQRRAPIDVKEAPIPAPGSQFQTLGSGTPTSQQAPGQPPIQAPPTDRKADLVRMIGDPNTQPRARQMYQAELAQLQTNESKQNASSIRDTSRSNEITQLLQNPNLGPRERQILMDQARGLPAPGVVPSPIGPITPPSTPPAAPPQQIQAQIAQIQAQLQNPGNSSKINQDLRMKLNQLNSQLQQQPIGPTQPPTPPQPQGPPTNQQTDAQNPMMKRRSFDNGRTWQMSQDGGRTWR